MNLDIGSLVMSLGVDTSGLLLAEKQVRKSADRMRSAYMAVGRDMQMIGRYMAFGLTLPLVTFGKASVKVFAEFENNMTKIIGLVGVSRTQTQKWVEDIKGMAVAVGKAPVELSNALFFITSAGIRGAAAMEVLRESAKAATAGLGDTKVVADLVTSAMNAFGKANLSARDATEALVATVREGKAMPEDLAKSMGIVLPVAAAIGMEFKEVGASIAAMTRTGTTAGTSAIYLRQILNTLLKPSKQTADALKSVGLSASYLRDVIDKQGLLQGLQMIKTATEGNDEALGKIFGNLRAFVGVVDIMGKNLKDTEGIFSRMQDNVGDLSKAFDAAQNTMLTFAQLSAKLQLAQLEIGKALAEEVLPMFDKFLTYLVDLAKEHSGFIVSLTKFGVVVPVLTIVLGTLLNIYGSLIASMKKFIIFIARGTMAIKRYTVGVQGMNKKMLAATAGMKGFAAAASVVVLALAAIWFAVDKVVSRLTQLSEAQKTIAKINNVAAKSVAAEKIQIDGLLAILREETTTRNDKKEALARLNTIVGDSVGLITMESLAYGKAESSAKKYLTVMKDMAKERTASQVLMDAEVERLDVIMKVQTANYTGWQKWKRINQAWAKSNEDNGIAIIGLKDAFKALDREAIATANETYQQRADAARKYLDKEKVYALDYLGTWEDVYTDIAAKRGEGITIPFAADANPSLSDKQGAGAWSMVSEHAEKQVGIVGLASDAVKAYKKELGLTTMQYEALEDRAGGLKSVLSLQEKTIKELVEITGNKYNPLLADLQKEYRNTKATLDAYNASLKENKVDMEFAAVAAEAWYDGQKKLRELTGDNTDDLMKSMGSNAISMMSSEQDIPYLFSPAAQVVLMDMNQNLADNQKIAAALGLTYKEIASNDVAAYEQALIDLALIPNKSAEQIEEMQRIQVLYQALQVEAIKYIPLIQQVGSAFTSLGNIISEFFGEDNPLSKFFDGLGDGIRLITTLANVMQTFQGIMEILNISTKVNTGLNVMNTAATVKNTAAKVVSTPPLVAANAALAASAAALAVAGATAAGASLPFPYNLAAMAAGVAGVEVALATTPAAVALTATGLAEGGIIPDGYKGDKFPAMLDSGEAVIPLRKLPELVNMSGGGQSVEVFGRIKGEDIYLLNREVARKRNNSF